LQVRAMTNTLLHAEAVVGEQLSAQQVQQWRDKGFVFVRDLLPAALVDELAAAAGQHYPAAGTPAAKAFTDFGSGGALTFPSAISGLNQVSLHPGLLNAMAALLDTSVAGLRLSQSDLWAKYGRQGDALDKPASARTDNNDQRMHVDYPNHTLVHPPPWQRPEAVEVILYLTDAVDNAGGTAVVPRSGPDDPAYRWPIVDSPGIGELRYINPKGPAETYFAEQRPHLAGWRQQLYQRERQATYKAGDMLLYRHDTWHRGTPLAPGARRLVHNLTYRKAGSEWISTLHAGWAWQAYRDDKMLERLVATASVEQRCVLGFPAPGSDYWCAETLAAVEARYGMFGFDSTPYSHPDETWPARAE
jgi:hypothetical protein